jgi:hypothetical protein
VVSVVVCDVVMGNGRLPNDACKTIRVGLLHKSTPEHPQKHTAHDSRGHAKTLQPVHMQQAAGNMTVSTAAQRPLAVPPCQGQRPLLASQRLHPHALRTPQATARQQRHGGHLVLCSAVAEKPVASNGAPAGDFKAWESVITSVKQRDDIKTIMLFGAGPIVIGQVSTSRMQKVGTM